MISPNPAKSTVTRRASLPLPTVRRQIWDQAIDLAITGDKRDIADVLANRFKVSKRTILLTLMAEGMTHERTSALFRNGMKNLLDESRNAEAAIVAELEEAA